MTQALAMRHLLEEAGHSVGAVCLGTSDRREAPSFFLDNIGAPVTRFRSPNFVAGEGNRGILVGASMWRNLLRAETFIKSLSILDQVVDETRPDLVINFYEPLWGLYQKRHPSKVTSVCVAHQLLAGHPDFPLPRGRAADKAMLLALNAVAAGGSSRRLGLSFTPMPEPDPEAIGTRLAIVPPLLRPALSGLTPTDGDYILAYVLQSGYGEDIVSWHDRHPSVKMHCFWDRKDANEVGRHSRNLTFHRLSGVKFLRMMAGCRGFVTTAGFESVCEAMYLGKPVLMVPVGGHYEQECNALDAKRAGAGIWSTRFDLDAFIDYLPRHKTDPTAFRTWVDSAPEQILAELERVVNPRS